jgi:uncharacterized membrane protein
MKRSLEREIFWKTLIWRIVFSIPLSMLINYLFYHSITVVLGITVVSNIIGHIAHYLFEINWPKIWSLINRHKFKILRNRLRDNEETK